MKNEYLRHTLSTISYRFQKAVRSANTDFGNFSLGNGSRTPAETLNHMCHVLHATRIFLVEEVIQEKPPEKLEFHLEIDKFNSELKKLDSIFINKDLGINYSKKLLQGPLSDILTHIGQLSMLRKLSGDSISGEDFSAAAIITGIA